MAETKLIRDHHLLTRNLKLNDNYISNDGGDEGIRITDAGLVGIGNPVPGATLEVSVAGSDALAGRPSIEISSYSDARDDARSAGVLKFQKVANDTINTFGAGSHTAAGEVIGRIEAYGVTNDDDGFSDVSKLSSYIEFAGDAVADETDAPGKIVFATASTTTGGLPTARMTIDDGGNVGIGVADPDSLLEVFGESAQLKLSWNASNYADITVADDGHLEIATTGTDGDITLDSASGIMLETSSLYVYPTGASTQSFYFDMSGDPKLTINSQDNAGDEFSIQVNAEGATTIANEDADTAAANLTLDVDGDIILDSANGTFRLYDTGDTSDYLRIRVAEGTGATILETVSAAADGHLSIIADGHVEFDNCAVGFDALTATFGASTINPSGPSTDIDFRLGNKFVLEMGTVNIDSGSGEYLNLIFPATSGNFILVIGQDGTGSRTIASGSWRAYDSGANLCGNLLYANGTDGDIRWAGGSAPTLTTTADKEDIISIFWHADSETAFAVVSQDF